MALHTQEKLFFCGECDERFSDIRLLNHHANTSCIKFEAENQNGKSFFCSFCGDQFATKIQLALHKMDETEKEKKDMEQYQTHLKNRTGEKSCACKICGLKFGRYQNLKTHLKIHDREELYVCCDCNEGFAEDYHLAYHILECHLNKADSDAAQSSQLTFEGRNLCIQEFSKKPDGIDCFESHHCWNESK